MLNELLIWFFSWFPYSITLNMDHVKFWDFCCKFSIHQPLIVLKDYMFIVTNTITANGFHITVNDKTAIITSSLPLKIIDKKLSSSRLQYGNFVSICGNTILESATWIESNITTSVRTNRIDICNDLPRTIVLSESIDDININMPDFIAFTSPGTSRKSIIKLAHYKKVIVPQNNNLYLPFPVSGYD